MCFSTSAHAVSLCQGGLAPLTPGTGSAAALRRLGASRWACGRMGPGRRLERAVRCRCCVMVRGSSARPRRWTGGKHARARCEAGVAAGRSAARVMLELKLKLKCDAVICKLDIKKNNERALRLTDRPGPLAALLRLACSARGGDAWTLELEARVESGSV